MTDGEAKMGEDMLHAIDDGDTVKMRELASYGFNVNSQINIKDAAGKESCWTPLIKASAANRADLVDILISELAAEVDGRATNGYNALITAAYGGNLDVVRCLVFKGADPTWVGPQGKKASDWAKERNHADVVSFLSEAPERKRAHNQSEVVLSRPLGDRVLQEVFNFNAKDRITLIRKTADGPIEGMARQDFSDIDDKDALKAALEKFRYYGGEADDSVIGGKNVKKGRIADSGDCTI